MMKIIKISEATNPQLNWLVADLECKAGKFSRWEIRDCLRRPLAAGEKPYVFVLRGVWSFASYCTDPAKAWPIIERMEGLLVKSWFQSAPESKCEVHMNTDKGDFVAFGPTILIAAMRCFMASKLGDTAEVPEELT
jgi:hypothetical protein